MAQFEGGCQLALKRGRSKLLDRFYSTMGGKRKDNSSIGPAREGEAPGQPQNAPKTGIRKEDASEV